jgi:hypothetical protein
MAPLISRIYCTNRSDVALVWQSIARGEIRFPRTAALLFLESNLAQRRKRHVTNSPGPITPTGSLTETGDDREQYASNWNRICNAKAKGQNAFSSLP